MSSGLSLLVAAIGLVVTLVLARLTARLTAGLDTIPTHFNIAGDADGFGPRWVSFALIPAIQVTLVTVLLVLPLLGLPIHGNSRIGTIVVQASIGLGFALAQGAVFMLMWRWKRRS